MKFNFIKEACVAHSKTELERVLNWAKHVTKKVPFVMGTMIGCCVSVTIVTTSMDNILMDILYPEE